MANPEQNLNGLENDYGKKIDDITAKINELADGNPENDENARKELQGLINNEFYAGLEKYLTDAAKAENFRNSIGCAIKKLVDKFSNEGEIPDYIKDLLSGVKKFGITVNLEQNPGVSKKGVDGSDNIQEPELGLTNSTLDGIVQFEVKDGDSGSKQGERNFHSRIDQNRDSEGRTKLERTENQISSLSDKIGKIDDKDGVLPEKVKNKISEVNNLLKNFLSVIDNTTTSNVKKLQQYIFDNLDEGDKENFKIKNKYNADKKEFDGLFGESTLEGLNKVLSKISAYIDKIPDYSKKLMENKENEGREKEGVEKDPNIAAILSAFDLRLADFSGDRNNAGLPSEGDIYLRYSIVGENGTKKPQDGHYYIENNEYLVYLPLKSGESSKRLKISDFKPGMKYDQAPWEDRIVDGANDNNADKVAENSSPENEPLSIGNDRYQVMENSQEIAQISNLNGATFYTVNKFAGEQPKENEKWKLANVPTDGKDYECYMKLANGNKYKVKVDASGNLCPIATEISDTLNDKHGVDAQISLLLSNNPSCINYLKNKLPDNIKKDCTIGWNERFQDYTLKSRGRELTIEPMTIAGDWNVSSNLSTCLAFLNLTNYIRTEGASRGKIDPDVSSGLKIRGIRNGRNSLYIDKGRFGLGGATSQELLKFKSYNNGERWEDDWDKKRPNRIYKKVNLPVGGVNVPAAPATETPTPAAPATETPTPAAPATETPTPAAPATETPTPAAPATETPEEEKLKVKLIDNYSDIKDSVLSSNLKIPDLQGNCKKMIADAFNIAVEKCENEDGKAILNDLRDGLLNGDTGKIKLVQQSLGIGKDGIFGMMTFKKVLNYYGIQRNGEWIELRNEIDRKRQEAIKKSGQTPEGSGDDDKKSDVVDNNMDEVVENENRDEVAENYINSITKLLRTDQDRERFNKIVSESNLKAQYVNGIIEKDSFVVKINALFGNEQRTYRTLEGDNRVPYNFICQLNLKGEPMEGKRQKYTVEFNNNGKTIRYKCLLDGSGRISSCESYDKSINIKYDENNVPYFECGGRRLLLNLHGDKNIPDIGRIASMINYMTSIVEKRTTSLTKLNKVTVDDDDNLHAAFHMGRGVTLKANVISSMYLQRVDRNDIGKWFTDYFNEQVVPPTPVQYGGYSGT